MHVNIVYCVYSLCTPASQKPSGNPMEATQSISRAASTERGILQAARALLAEQGMAGLAMRTVARRAGITAGAIYRHFPDKQALVDRVVGLAFQHLELRLFKAIAPLPVGSFQRVVALGGAYIAFAEENREEFKILFDPFRPGPRKVREFPGRIYPILRDCIADAMQSGELRSSDPDLAAFHLWSRVHGVVMLLMACDFSDELSHCTAQFTAPALFEATREFIAFGMLHPDLLPRTPSSEDAAE